MTDLADVGPGSVRPLRPGTTPRLRLAPQPAQETLPTGPVAPDVPLRRRRWVRGYIRWAVGLDVLAGVLGSLLALGVRLGGGPFSDRYFEYAEITTRYIALSVITPALWVAAIWWGGGYQRRRLGSGADEFQALIRADVALLALIGFLSYATKSEIARWYVLIEIPSVALLSLLLRYRLRRWLHREREQGRCLERTVVVGRLDGAADLIEQIGRSRELGMEVVAVCAAGLQETDDGVTMISGVPVMRYPEEAIAAVDLVNAEVVAVSGHPDLTGHELRRFAWALEERDVDLIVSPGILEVAGSRLTIRPSVGLSLLHIERPEMSGVRRAAKNTLDRVITLLAILVAAPLLLLIALAVCLDSRGPVLFRQTRVGERGEEFTMLKFRTMVRDADRLQVDLTGGLDVNKRLFKLQRDPRVTRVGRILRRYSLDELPQLANVLQGRMSLVGPRPSLPAEVADYEQDETRRLRVRPGLTGLWQVSGRSDLSWEESLRLDLWYVDNWSPVLDLQIMARTARAVVKGRGAY
ncbi:sugar transferase [Luteipulveratus sp. YIM 133132]|uniref:sugar transferase n=1 Tax=Luteipulveratus flavus TaxID=3031728 RepID=UPI0023B05A5A|nr:sugar transferase [Luteipulveratus sp. YIM 133132]MDE9364292.1 sugar transferase [Luteipulveratus sp. YIM 133132]